MVYVNGALAGQWATGLHRLRRRPRRPPALRRGQRDPGRVPRRTRTPAGTPAPASTGRCTWSSAPLTHIALDGVRVTTKDVDARVRRRRGRDDGRERRPRPGARSTSSPSSGTATAPSSPPRPSPVTVLPGEPAVVRQRLLVADPALWGPDSPALYTATVVPAGRRRRVVDDDAVTFGIRTLSLDPQRGLRINGEPVHAPRRVRPLRQRRARRGRRSAAPTSGGSQLLKAAGFNALRSAHNPMSRAMLDACDRLRRPRHGRADRHVDREQVRLRRGARLPGVVGARRRGDGPQGRQPPERRLLLDRQRDPRGRQARTARSGRGGWRRRCARSTPPGSSPTAINGDARASSARRSRRRRPRAGINTMLTDMGAFMDELGALRAGRRRGRRSPSTSSTRPA